MGSYLKKYWRSRTKDRFEDRLIQGCQAIPHWLTCHRGRRFLSPYGLIKIRTAAGTRGRGEPRAMADAPTRKIALMLWLELIIGMTKSTRSIGDEIRICLRSAAVPAQFCVLLSSYSSHRKWKKVAFYVTWAGLNTSEGHSSVQRNKPNSGHNESQSTIDNRITTPTITLHFNPDAVQAWLPNDDKKPEECWSSHCERLWDTPTM